MPFSHLSNEVVLSLGEWIDDSDLNALARSCQSLYRLLNPYLYSRDVKSGRYSALAWAVSEVNLATAKRTLEAGADPTRPLLPKSNDTRELLQLEPPLVYVVRHATEWCWYTSRRAEYRRKSFQKDAQGFPIWDNRRYLSMISLLLENGGELFAPGAHALLQLAGLLGCTELLRLVFRYGAHPDMLNSNNHPERVMVVAAEGGCVEVLQMLLDYGFPLDNDRLCRLPRYVGQLHTAARANQIAAVRFLLQSGVFVDQGNYSHCTSLRWYLHHVSPSQLDMEMVRLLVHHGADLNDRGLETPLLYTAMKFEDDSLISYLVGPGADVHWAATDGATLLFKALSDYPGASYPVLKLAELGIDLEARDQRGRTALIYGTDVFCTLKPWGTLLHLPVNLDARDDRGWTALHIVAARNDSERAQMLVEASADINATTTSDGLTALHIAIDRTHAGMVRKLLDLGAKANIRDPQGKRPLDIFRGLGKRSAAQRQIKNMLLAKMSSEAAANKSREEITGDHAGGKN